MKTIIIIICTMFISQGLSAKSFDSLLMPIGASEESSSILQVDSTTQGMLVPRMDTTARDNISAPADGLFIYNTSTKAFNFFNDSVWGDISGVGGTVFADDVFRIQDNGDNTKELAFEVSAISNSTTRTVTMPDADIDLGALVVGPSSVIDTAIAVFNSTTGKLIKEISKVLSSDTITSPEGGTGPGFLFTGTDAAVVRASDQTSIAGQKLVLAAGSGTAANANGGDVVIRSGLKNGSGTGGTIFLKSFSGELNIVNAQTLVSNNAFSFKIDTCGLCAFIPVGDALDKLDIGRNTARFDEAHMDEILFYEGNTTVVGNIDSGTQALPQGSSAGFWMTNPGNGVNAASNSIGVFTATLTTTVDAGNVEVQAGSNTNGSSGDGGSVGIKAGESTAGLAGKVELSGRYIRIMGLRVIDNEVVSLTADDQNVTATETYISLSSDDGTPANRTFTLETCEITGQELIIVWGANAGELLDDSAQGTAGSHRLSADWTPDTDDTLSLICDGQDWIEVSRSAN